MEDFLGDRAERLNMITYCEGIFQRKVHSSWCFSDAQKDLLMDLDKSVTIMDCVAGAGKTTILLAMAMWIIKKNREGSDVCLHYMAESQELADDFRDQLVKLLGSRDGIFPLGFDPIQMVDRLSIDLRLKLNQNQVDAVVSVTRLDAGLDFLARQYEAIRAFVDDGSSWRFLDLMRSVMTAHHVVTHRTFYTPLRKAQAELLHKPACLVSTPAVANRLDRTLSPWARTFGNMGRTLTVVDQMQALGHLEMLGFIISFSFLNEPWYRAITLS